MTDTIDTMRAIVCCQVSRDRIAASDACWTFPQVIHRLSTRDDLAPG